MLVCYLSGKGLLKYLKSAQTPLILQGSLVSIFMPTSLFFEFSGFFSKVAQCVPFPHSPSYGGPCSPSSGGLCSPSSGGDGSIEIPSSGVVSLGDRKQRFFEVSMVVVALL